LDSNEASAQAERSEIQRVVSWSEWTYAAKGHSVHTVEFAECITALYVEDIRRTELVLTSEHYGCLDHERLKAIRAAGEVWVVTPLSTVGRAHSLLRGHVDRLVPYWTGDDQIKFGMPQIP
jgi:hypothetical protein